MAVLSAEQQGSASGVLQKLNFPALGYALLPLLLAVRHVNAPPDTRTYGPSHWFLDYHHGFMRRALVGELFSHMRFISWRNIFLIEAIVLACAVGLTYLVFRPTLFGSLDERKLAAFLLAAPAFLPHMALMGGELDNFLYIVLLVACWLLARYPGTLGLCFVTLCTALALAIHEAFLLMFYPLLLVLILDLLHRKKVTRAGVAIHGVVVVLCFAAILVYGKFHGAQADWIARAQQRTDMPIEEAVLIPLHNTLREQIAFVRQRYTHLLVSRVCLTLILSVPYGIALWRLLCRTFESRGSSLARSRWMTAIFFLPLCLAPLGHDIMRWLAALCIDMSLYVLLVHQERNHRERGNQESSRQIAPTHQETLALRDWSRSPATTATFLYLIALGPWGLAGTRLFSNLGSVLSGNPLH